MDDAEGVQELNRESKLVDNFLGLVFGELEISALEVVKEISSAHVLKDKVEVLSILEDIHQPYNVRMFGHLHYVNFSPGLMSLNNFHVRLRHYLNGHLRISRLVCGKLHQTELTLADCPINCIELVDVGLAGDLGKTLGPERALCLRSEEESPRLLRHECQFKRPYYIKGLLGPLERGLLFWEL